MGKHRAGVIGHTGRGNYGHGLDNVYLVVPDVDLVAVADADADGLVSAGERLHVPGEGRYSDYREMLATEELDLVSVAPRWVGQHEAMVVAAAESGVKGIFCEKPLAQSPAQADAMIDACDRNGVKLAIAHQLRTHPSLLEAHRLIGEGFIGEVREVHGLGKQDSRGGGQDLVVLGTHILDLMCMFGGDAQWVEATAMQDGALAERRHAREGDEEVGPLLGDHLRATYVFENGILGTFSTRKGGDPSGGRAMGLHLMGTKGILAWRGGHLMHYPDPVWAPYPTEESWEVIRDDKGFSGLPSLNVVIVGDMIEAFGTKRDPVASGRHGRASLEMIVGVYAAHRHGRTKLPLEDREHPLADWVDG